MSQLDSSIGFKKQVDFTTGATVDRFLEFIDESFDFDRTYYQGAGMRPGSRFPRSSRNVLVKDGAKGEVNLEVPTRGIGALLELMLGVVSSTLVPTTTGVYQQLFTPIENDYLPVATFQKGIPRLGTSTVDAYTMRSMGCSDFEFSLANAEVLKLKSSWVGRELVTDVAYATPSYAAGAELLSFVGADLIVGGSVTPPTATALAVGGTAVATVRDFSFGLDHGFDGNGWNLGGAGKRSRPPAVGVAAAKGKLKAEYSTTDFRDAVASNSDLALVATFEGPSAIESSYFPTVQIVLPNVKFGGAMPAAAGGDVITQDLEFIGYDNLVAASSVYIAVRTADTAP